MLDVAGQPVPGLALSIIPEWLVNNRDIKTDAKGQFTVTPNRQNMGGMNNKLCVIARDSARNLAVAEDINDGTTTLELRLAPGLTVAGALTDTNGKPLTNGTASISLWVGNMASGIQQDSFHTDGRGRFVISALPANRRYWLWTTAPGYGSASQNIETGESETNRIEFEPFPLKLADQPLAGRVTDVDDKPIAKVRVGIGGNGGQPSDSVETDQDGRFKFKGVCEGTVQMYANLFANGQSMYANAGAEAGDTNVVIVLSANNSGIRQIPKRQSLLGKPLPDLASAGIGATSLSQGKPLLVCLFDIEQRPSRRFTRLLAERAGALDQSGVIVLGLQAAPIAAAAFKEWHAAGLWPFAVGQVTNSFAETKWATEVESFPWLILTGADHKVAAEGFALEDLDAKIREMKK